MLTMSSAQITNIKETEKEDMVRVSKFVLIVLIVLFIYPKP